MSALITTPEELEVVIERVVRRVMGDRPTRPEPRLTSEQAADELGVKVQTVERWARSGKLHGERQHRRWRFTREDLEAFRSGGGQIAELARRAAQEMLRGGKGSG